MLNRRTAAPFYNPRQGPAPDGGDSTPDEHAGDASRHFATSPSAQGIIDYIESQHILNVAPAEHDFLFHGFTAGQLETLKPLRDFDTGYAVGFTDFRTSGDGDRVLPYSGAYARAEANFGHPPAHHPVVDWFREEQQLLFLQGGYRFTEDALPTHDAQHNSYSISLRLALYNYSTAHNWQVWQPTNPLIRIENTGNQYPLTVGATYRGLIDGTASSTPTRQPNVPATGWTTVFHLLFVLSGPHQTGFRGIDSTGLIQSRYAMPYGVMGYVERY